MECLHIGTTSSSFHGFESKTIYVHNFLDLPDANGDHNCIVTPQFCCFGHKWEIAIYPGGDDNAINGSITIGIKNCSSKRVSIGLGVTVVKRDGGEVESPKMKGVFAFDPQVCTGGDLIKRQMLMQDPLNYLQNGSLVIKVYMQLSGRYGGITPHFFSVHDNMDIFLDDETSDVAFKVRGGGILVGHKGIIKAQARDLYIMCAECSKANPMLVTDVDEDTFRILLRSLYGGFILPEEWRIHSGPILKAAGKYGFDNLKSEAEGWYAKCLAFTLDNAVDRFLEADGNSHSIIREAAKKFIAEHAKEIINSESFARLHESMPLVQEVMTAALDNSRKRKRGDE